MQTDNNNNIVRYLNLIIRIIYLGKLNSKILITSQYLTHCIFNAQETVYQCS